MTHGTRKALSCKGISVEFTALQTAQWQPTTLDEFTLQYECGNMMVVQ